MSYLRPSTIALIKSISSNLRMVIAPELSSTRAVTTLGMIRDLLAEILMRQEHLDLALKDSVDRAHALLPDLMPSHDATTASPASELTSNSRSTAGEYEKILCAIEVAITSTSEAGASETPETLDFFRRVLQYESVTSKAVRSGVVREAADAESAHTANKKSGLDLPQFSDYLAQRFPGSDLRATQIERVLGGFSKDTYFLELTGANSPARAIVIRCDNPASPIKTSVIDEYHLLQKLFLMRFPVAEPLWAEFSTELLGAPFMVSRKMAGAPVLDSIGTRLLCNGEEAKRAARQLARVLAQLHSLDLKALGFPAEELRVSTKEHIVRQVNELDAYWHEHRFGPEPVMAVAFQWLRDNVPTSSAPLALVHGDASLRNLLFSNGEVEAVLDWETVHLGDPAEDLAYCRRDIEPILPWSEFIGEYYAHGGAPFDEESAEYFQLWARVRNGAFGLACAVGFERFTDPDLRLAYAGIISYRNFLDEISGVLREHL